MFDSSLNKFFGLLRYSLGTEGECPRMHLYGWRTVFEISRKQSISAFIGSSLTSIKGNVLIEDDEKSKEAFGDLIMDWTGQVIKTARRNQKLNRDVIEEISKLGTKGLQSCLLKGQGNALMYPNPYARTPGDIDVWVRFKDQANDWENIRRIIKLVKTESPEFVAAYHHIDAPDINGTPVEVHYRPHFMLSFIYNSRLQKYFAGHMDEQFSHYVKFDDTMIAVPTPEFNAVFQLSHIFNHLTHEGIGLRQILDYYFVLQKLSEQSVDLQKLSKTLNSLGLLNFAGAIMWILVNILGMDDKWAIADLDEKRGRFVINEIVQGGNFGRYDSRSEVKYFDNPITVQYRHIMRNVHLFEYFPHHALVEPLARGVLFFKRKMLNK